ncbi:D-2-hydroxyacid dehydrogenase [Nocardioides sp.]|uniref:D-2-hydroxyacid dehydrogenase n=1 Tax=Nocardioides sp. TaxID=35761 RepID=UPI003562EF99
MTDSPVVVALMFPAAWDNRPATELAADIARLESIDPRIRVIDERYVDPDELRLRRGQDPTADLRAEAPPLTEAQRSALAQAEVILTQDLPFDVAELAPSLRWVQGIGAGVSQLHSAGLPDAAQLTTAAGVSSTAIAEFVFARILQMVKRLPEIDALAEQQSWRPTYGTQLSGRTLTVVGLGSIGRRVALLGRAFGMQVRGVRRSVPSEGLDPDVDRLFATEDLGAAVSGAHGVVAALPESPQTRDVFDAETFAAMAQGGIFVNVGRGSAVDEDALAGALTDGRLGGAALDVVKDEPLPSQAPLWAVPNLYLSPHSAAAPEEYWRSVFDLFATNLERYLAGEQLVNRVTAP